VTDLTPADRAPATAQPCDVHQIVEEARLEAAVLLGMEREHSGSGRDGHLSERDLMPLLRALRIEP